MRIFSYALLLLCLLTGWLVGWSNSSLVSFSFLGWQAPQLPVFVFYFLFLFVGLIAGVLLGRWVGRKRPQ